MNWQQAVLTVFAGTVIGYVTNWIAIRMLFRPRREVRVLGIHVPFTPGVIPRGKKRLAGGIGKVVGGMLLTGDNVARHLLRPEVEQQVRRGLEKWLEELVDKGVTLGELLGGNGAGVAMEPERPAGNPGGACITLHRLTGESALTRTGKAGTTVDKTVEGTPGSSGGVHGGVRDELARALSRAAAELLRSDETRRPLARFVAGVARDLLDRPVGKTVESRRFAALKDALGGLLAGMLAREDMKEELRDCLAQRIESFLRSPEKVGDYLPRAVREGIHRFITDQTPGLISALAQYLNSPGARRAMQNRIDNFFEGTPLKRILGGFFQLAGSGSGVMVQRLTREIAAFLAGDHNRAAIEERLHILADEALDKSMAEITASLDDTARWEKATEIAAWLLDRLSRPEAVEAFWDALEEFLVANSQSTWIELLNLDGGALVEKAENIVDGWLASLAGREEGRRLLDNLAGRAADGLWNAPLNRLLELLRPGLGEQPGEIALRFYRYAVRAYIQPLLQFFDVTGMVRRQVEELDELQVEELVLGIVRRELVAITWLGALLGAVLGAGTVGMQFILK